MINPSFKELERINSSRYAICVITAKRARKIIDGSEPLIKTKSKSPVTIALNEIMENKVTYSKDE